LSQPSKSKHSEKEKEKEKKGRYASSSCAREPSRLATFQICDEQARLKVKKKEHNASLPPDQLPEQLGTTKKKGRRLSTSQHLDDWRANAPRSFPVLAALTCCRNDPCNGHSFL